MNHKSVLIYAPAHTNRHRYAFQLLFKDVLGIDFTITDDADLFTKSENPKISYANQPLGDELFFEASPLLYQQNITPQHFEVFTYKENPAFIKVSERSALPFDLFAASFYLATRYEEYLSNDVDTHGRYKAINSMAYKHGFLQKPLINIWTGMLYSIIAKKYDNISCWPHKFNFIPTFDIDIAYAHKHKGFKRLMASYAKLITMAKFKTVVSRTAVLLGLKKDAFNTYRYIKDVLTQNKLQAHFFFLVGDLSFYDKSLHWKNPGFRTLIKRLAQSYHIGIHLSYNSNQDIVIINKEIARLSEIIQKPITSNRQHFLRLHLPETYRNLIFAGITDDFTMGYAEYTGFRASLCTPFYYYDLQNETITSLRIHPFAFMDGTYIDYLNYSPLQAIQDINSLTTEVFKTGGTLYCLWHNHTFSEAGPWKGWCSAFEESCQFASEQVLKSNNKYVCR